MTELLIVLAIAGVGAAIVVPRYGGVTQTYRLKTAAGRVASDFQAVRELATAASRRHRIEFSKGRGGYWVMQADDPITSAIWHADLSSAPYDAEILSADFAGGWTATISGFGLPAAPGTLAIGAGTRQITVSFAKDGSTAVSAITRQSGVVDSGVDVAKVTR